MATASTRVAPAAVFRPLEEGGVVLNVETGDYYELNPTGRFLWEHVEAGTSDQDIATALAERYSIDVDAAATDVAEFLTELRNRRLIES